MPLVFFCMLFFILKNNNNNNNKERTYRFIYLVHLKTSPYDLMPQQEALLGHGKLWTQWDGLHRWRTRLSNNSYKLYEIFNYPANFTRLYKEVEDITEITRANAFCSVCIPESNIIIQASTSKNFGVQWMESNLKDHQKMNPADRSNLSHTDN